MDLEQYQTEARKTAIYPDLGHNYWYPGLGLCGETGEVAENIKKIYRDDGGIMTGEREAKLVKELGDALWYLSNLASEMNISLSYIAIENLRKLRDRADRGKLHGSGDTR